MPHTLVTEDGDMCGFRKNEDTGRYWTSYYQTPLDLAREDITQSAYEGKMYEREWAATDDHIKLKRDMIRNAIL